MLNFNENLKTLPSAEYIQQLELLDNTGRCVTVIENRPGQSGSVRVYAAVTMAQHGLLNKTSAQHALEFYAEHAADARSHPGRHPNIDRLFEIIDNVLVYQVEIIAILE